MKFRNEEYLLLLSMAVWNIIIILLRMIKNYITFYEVIITTKDYLRTKNQSK